MLTFLIALFGIIITILLIIGVHEAGHFFVAKLLGIKVLRFSIGFGKALLRWHDKQGTEYVLAAIPLGGYVKMLDETEEEVASTELHLSFNRQPFYKRFAVIIAGPIANLIFAVLIYWFLFMMGFTTIKPIIGNIMTPSIANTAKMKPQQEITHIDHSQVSGWMAIMIRMLSRTGDHTQMSIETKDLHTSATYTYQLNLAAWHLDELNPDPLASLGIVPYEPFISPTIGKIIPHSAAEKSSLRTGDKVIAINNKPILTWTDLAERIDELPEKTIPFKIQRDGKRITLPVTFSYQRDLFFKKHGVLGISPAFTWPENLLQKNQYTPLPALKHAWQNMVIFTKMNFIVIGKLFTGKISLQSLGGPITIFGSAGSALNHGMVPFLSFLAFLSISIGIINILPIPGLDGGQALFHLIEFILRRPIPFNIQILLFRLGIIFLILLMTQALINDVTRLIH